MPGTTFAGIERGLFHFREIVFGIAVQFEFAHFDERIVLVIPDLGQIKGW